MGNSLSEFRRSIYFPWLQGSQPEDQSILGHGEIKKKKRKRRKRRRSNSKTENEEEATNRTVKTTIDMDLPTPTVSDQTDTLKCYIAKQSDSTDELQDTISTVKHHNLSRTTITSDSDWLYYPQEHPCMDSSMAPSQENIARTSTPVSEGMSLDDVFEDSAKLTDSQSVYEYQTRRRSTKGSVTFKDKLPIIQAYVDSQEELWIDQIKDYAVEQHIMTLVARSIGKDWKAFARLLIADVDVDAIEDRGESINNMTYEALRKWKQQTSRAATVGRLIYHLETLKRLDVVDEIVVALTPHSPEPISTLQNGQCESSGKLHVLQTIRKNLTRDYQALKMRGLPWMENFVLTLQDYYVDVIMTKVDQRGREASEQMNLEDIFKSSEENENAVRVLIEGSPGSGKTTLAAKLAYDWAKDNKYIRHFDLVLLLPVRLFQDTWKNTLERAALVKDEDADSFAQIVNDEDLSVLFILDGYDEADQTTEEHILPLFKKDIFQHVSVILTSRRGRFACSREESGERTFLANADCVPVFTRFIDKRVLVKGFTEQQQEAFIEKHMQNLDESHKVDVVTKLDKMVDKEFLSCPLFLLMLIVVFTNDEDVKNAETKTDLFKCVFNLVIKRYFSKVGGHSVQDMDLFSFDDNGENAHIVLMTQFSQFALKAIKRNSHVFTRNEIMEKYNCDPRILGLGFLKQNLVVKGFRECVTHEPVHKTLLEFAAAYGVYLSHKRDNHYQFISDVITFRPGENYASLFFPFLMGLLGENAGAMFNIIISQAFEYSCKFEYLQTTLVETELTESILTCLTPFLPPEWKIFSGPPGNVVFDVCFLTSTQHEAIIRWGVQKGKICQITWDLLQDACLPTDVEVDTLVLDMRWVEDITNILPTIRKNTQYSIWNNNHRKLHCKYLWCIFRDSFNDPDLSMQSFLDCLEFVDFQLISFKFSHLCISEENEKLYGTSQPLIPRICDVVAEGKLRNVHMYSMSADISAETSTLLNKASCLIAAERLESLELYVATTHQDEVNTFVWSASKSSYLRNFVFGSKSCCIDDTKHPLTVNLTNLCNKGQKSWKWVELVEVNVECNEYVKSSFFIRHLEVDTCCVLTSTTNLMQNCHVKSLKCAAALLADTSSQWPYQASLTELNITVDVAFIYRGLYSMAEKFKNLQVLGLTMTSLQVSSTPLPIEQWLWSALSILHLKGFEIWRFSKNATLAKNLVKGIVQCLEGKHSDTASRKEPLDRQSSLKSLLPNTDRLQLEYLMLNDADSDSVHQTAWCLQRLKTCLQLKCLQRLDMVFSTENKLTERFQLRSIILTTQVFPRDEGFKVEHDLWGSKSGDSIYSKGKHRMSLSKKDRISVTFKKHHHHPKTKRGDSIYDLYR